jgi:hypothetical protein
VGYLSDATFDRDRLRDLELSRHVIWNLAYLRPKSKKDNTERPLDHGLSFRGPVERLSLFRSWRSKKKKRKLVIVLHYYDCWFNSYIVEQVLDLMLWLFIQCFYYGTGFGSYNMVVDSMPILWSRYWFLYRAWLWLVFFRPGASKSVSFLKEQEKTKVRVYTVPIHSLGPPNALGTSLLLRPRLWKLFWSLDLNTKAITPWWRLLHDSIEIAAKLHLWNSVSFSRNMCPICQSEIEELLHFTVECLQKRDFWFYALEKINLVSLFPTVEAIWSGLITFHDLELSPLSQDYFVMLGLIFSCMWKYYWLCIIDEHSWQTSEVRSFFLANQDNIITKYRASVAFTYLSG